uniref:Uncharacterized protein n=1 Tax=Arundo donax TaxID=35708 RepID=A0A0A9E0M8_ARUDO
MPVRDHSLLNTLCHDKKQKLIKLYEPDYQHSENTASIIFTTALRVD